MTKKIIVAILLTSFVASAATAQAAPRQGVQKAEPFDGLKFFNDIADRSSQ